MMSLGESVICVAVVPGFFVGLALGIANDHFELHWWGKVFVGITGWGLGFLFAALCGTLIEVLTRRKSNRRRY